MTRRKDLAALAETNERTRQIRETVKATTRRLIADLTRLRQDTAKPPPEGEHDEP